MYTCEINIYISLNLLLFVTALFLAACTISRLKNGLAFTSAKVNPLLLLLSLLLLSLLAVIMGTGRRLVVGAGISLLSVEISIVLSVVVEVVVYLPE